MVDVAGGMVEVGLDVGVVRGVGGNLSEFIFH